MFEKTTFITYSLHDQPSTNESSSLS